MPYWTLCTGVEYSSRSMSLPITYVSAYCCSTFGCAVVVLCYFGPTVVDLCHSGRIVVVLCHIGRIVVVLC